MPEFRQRFDPSTYAPPASALNPFAYCRRSVFMLRMIHRIAINSLNSFNHLVFIITMCFVFCGIGTELVLVNLRLLKATLLHYCNGHQVYRCLKSVDLTAWTVYLYLFMKIFV